MVREYSGRSLQTRSKSFLLTSDQKEINTCGSCMKMTWKQLCCCCSGTKLDVDVSRSKVKESKTHETNNERKTKSSSDVKIETKEQTEVLSASDQDDSEKVRYSGRNFDVINLEEDMSPENDIDEKQDEETKNETSGEDEKPSRTTGKFRFMSTKRGAKKDSVYDKFSKF